MQPSEKDVLDMLEKTETLLTFTKSFRKGLPADMLAEYDRKYPPAAPANKHPKHFYHNKHQFVYKKDMRPTASAGRPFRKKPSFSGYHNQFSLYAKNARNPVFKAKHSPERAMKHGQYFKTNMITPTKFISNTFRSRPNQHDCQYSMKTKTKVINCRQAHSPKKVVVKTASKIVNVPASQNTKAPRIPSKDQLRWSRADRQLPSQPAACKLKVIRRKFKIVKVGTPTATAAMAKRDRPLPLKKDQNLRKQYQTKNQFKQVGPRQKYKFIRNSPQPSTSTPVAPGKRVWLRRSTQMKQMTTPKASTNNFERKMSLYTKRAHLFVKNNKKMVHGGGLVRLVEVSGQLYKSSQTKLHRANPTSVKKYVIKRMSNGIKDMKGVKIRGESFRVDRGGKRLVRVSSYNQQSKLSRVNVGGVTFVQKKTGVYEQLPQQKDPYKFIAQKKNRSITLTRKRVQQQQQLCRFLKRFGKCKYLSTCPFLHDVSKVMVCRNFLAGKCNRPCLLSHTPSKDDMPLCKYYLRGICSHEQCPYIHRKHTAGTEDCKEFAQGKCANGWKCSKRHVLTCDDYMKSGKCSRGKRCFLWHEKDAKEMQKSKKIHYTRIKPCSPPPKLTDLLTMDLNDEEIINVPKESSYLHGEMPSFIPFKKIHM